MTASLLLAFGLLHGCVFTGHSEKLWGTAFDVVAVDDKAYLCAGGSLLVLDVTDSHNLRLLGQIKISSLARAVRVIGDHAFVAAGERGLRVIDVSNPAHLSEVGGIDTPLYALGLRLEHGRVYVNSEGTWLAFDVTDPRNPVLIETLPVGSSEIAEVGRCQEGRLVFLADNATLRILARSDSDHAVEISRCILHPQSGIHGPAEISIAGDHAYISVMSRAYEYHLCIVDISDPTDPVVMGNCRISRKVENGIGKIYVRGDRAYVTTGFGGLLIVDVADAANPWIRGALKTSSNP